MTKRYAHFRAQFWVLPPSLLLQLAPLPFIMSWNFIEKIRNITNQTLKRIDMLMPPFMQILCDCYFDFFF